MRIIQESMDCQAHFYCYSIYLYREIRNKYGPHLVAIRRRIAAAAAIRHPENAFYPADKELAKSYVVKKGTALHKFSPSESEENKMVATRRELVGWPGLSLTDEELADGNLLPEMLRYGERTVRHLDHCLIAQAIREEALLSRYPLPALVIGFALWSDGCDANSSMSKANRGSLWALLLTLCCKIARINPFSYTYLVAIGDSVSALLYLISDFAPPKILTTSFRLSPTPESRS